MSLLLSYIASKVKTSTEDIATMSLHYILQNSQKASKALNLLVSNKLNRQPIDGIFFEIQQCAEGDDGRPDMTAYNRHGEQALLFEMKFKAVLTANQPNVYIERLRQDGGDALVFICPKQRLQNLTNDVMKRSNYQGNKKNCYFLENGTMPLMLILSWEEIISKLCEDIEEQYKDDLQQLKGLTSIMNRQDFKPFTKDDISLQMALRIVDYFEMIEKIGDFLVHNNMYIKEGFHLVGNTETKRIRYLVSADKKYGLGIEYNLERWIKEGKNNHKTSPFWLRIKTVIDDKSWGGCSQQHICILQENNIDVLVNKEKNQRVLYCPLIPLTHEEEYRVIEDLSGQVIRIIELLNLSTCQANMS